MANSNHDNWIEIYLSQGVDLVNRRVFLGEIDHDSVDKVIKALYLMDTQDNKAPCELFINSPGGDLYATLALYDILSTVKCPIHTFGYGRVMSAAPLILAAGDERWLASNTTLMFHDGTTDLSGTLRGTAADLKHLHGLADRWVGLLASHTNKDRRFWNGLTTKQVDVYFTADQAIDWGLADQIWKEK